jgi:hypothetical protein
LWQTVGVPRWVLLSTMSMKSLAVGTDWIDLKLCMAAGCSAALGCGRWLA